MTKNMKNIQSARNRVKSQPINHVISAAFVFILIIFQAKKAACLYCAAGTTECGIGYSTAGGGKCGADAVLVPTKNQGEGYGQFWCGSFYVGAIDSGWQSNKDSLKPV
jgi:hypothetical protein